MTDRPDPTTDTQEMPPGTSAGTLPYRGPDPDDEAPPAAPPPPGPYVARAGRYFRTVRYVIALATIAAGAWFLYDGFVTYPNQQQRYRELSAQLREATDRGQADEAARIRRQMDEEGVRDRTDADIRLQRILGFVLPPAGLLLLGRWLYISRGQIRLDETDTLHVPGHPPIPASAIVEVDDAAWDRKGIAWIRYEVQGEAGTVKLDDFVYDRKPIDDIHDRLKHVLAPEQVTEQHSA